MSECKHPVEIGKYLVKYCILPTGHKGKHVAEQKENMQHTSMRCVNVKNGIQCGLPNGHTGSHSVAGNIIKSWI